MNLDQAMRQAVLAGYRYHLSLERLQDHRPGEEEPPGLTKLITEQFESWRQLTIAAAELLEDET